MKLQIVTNTIGRSGKKVLAKRTINDDMVRVGRESGCELHLPDPRVALAEGFIVNRGGITFIREQTGQFEATRNSVQAHRFRVNEPIDIGPYTLTMRAAPAGFDGAIEVSLRVPLEGQVGEFSERVGATSLKALRLPKRWAAITLFLLAGLFAFLLPAVKPLNLPWAGVTMFFPKVTDQLWNPGPVIFAHQNIEQKCEACHNTAFVRVQDDQCLACHKMVGNHVGKEFHTATMFDKTRCASCHSDHKGRKPTQKDSDQFCIDCHQNIHDRAPTSKTQPVSDFAKNHPAFRLTLPDVTATPGPDGKVANQRVRMASGGADKADAKNAPREVSNLIFPHDVHLDAKGIRSPDKGRVVMECANCHKNDVSKQTFEPVNMEKHCQSCHKLEFEPAVTDRQVPHGKAREAKRVVSEFYAYLALNGTRDSFTKAFGIDNVGLLRRAGSPETTRAQVLAMAQGKADRVAEELFEIRTCKTCHAVTRQEKDDGPDWAVVKVASNAALAGELHAWLPQARFEHKSHAQAPCADCHDVKKSKSSADVAMPSIDTCRNCHGGKEAAEKKINSNCLSCHGFHQTGLPWGLQDAVINKAKTNPSGLHNKGAENHSTPYVAAHASAGAKK